MPISVNAAKSNVDFLEVNAAKSQVDFVKVNAAKSLVYTRSDPQTQTFDLLQYSEAYWGDPGQKIGTSPSVDGDKFARFGYTFNNAIERTMIAMTTTEQTAMESFIATRPVITQMRLFLWLQHTNNGLTRSPWLGWFSGGTGSPTNFSRLHTEQQTSWATGISAPTAGGAGQQRTYVLASNSYANISSQIQAGNIRGITISEEAADNNVEWGWYAGRYYCTNESGGICAGSVIINTGATAQRPRLEITADFS